MILICDFPDPHLAVYSPIGLFLSYRLLDTESAHCQVAVVFGICRNAVLHCNIIYVDAIGGCDDNLRSTDITYRFISVKWKTKILMYDLETTPKPKLKVVEMWTLKVGFAIRGDSMRRAIIWMTVTQIQ